MSPPHIRERLELVRPFTVPKPPPQFVQRCKEFEGLVVLLLEKGTVAITTALSGGGGFGHKAQAICHDERVKAAFPDGILAVTVGQMPNLVELVNNQIFVTSILRFAIVISYSTYLLLWSCFLLGSPAAPSLVGCLSDLFLVYNKWLVTSRLFPLENLQKASQVFGTLLDSPSFYKKLFVG